MKQHYYFVVELQAYHINKMLYITFLFVILGAPMSNNDLKSSELTLTHLHFIIDGVLTQRLNEETRMDDSAKLTQKLMSTLSMSPLGKLEFYDASDQNFPGWSYIQPITTSHISVHYFDERTPHVHMDIYSCKEFDWKKIIVVLNDFMSLKTWKADLIIRDADDNKRIISRISGEGYNILENVQIAPI